MFVIHTLKHLSKNHIFTNLYFMYAQLASIIIVMLCNLTLFVFFVIDDI